MRDLETDSTDLVLIGERLGRRSGDWVKVSVFDGPDRAPIRVTVQRTATPSPQTVWLTIKDTQRFVEWLLEAIVKAEEA